MQSSMRRLTSSLLLSTFYISLFSCKKTTKPQPLPPPVVVPSADKTIAAFNFTKTSNSAYIISDVVGIVETDSIKITVPAETDITSLRPSVLFTGKKISPSGDLERNFSSPQNYIVTAEDGSHLTV